MQEYIDFIQSNVMLCVVWAGLLIAVVMSFVKAGTATYKEISTGELTHLINKENAVVIDTRSQDEFKQGHITDSVHILPSQITDGNLGSLENKKSDPIIVVCKTGQTSPATAKALTKAGFEQVKVLKTGLIAWNEAKLPLVRGKK